MEPSEYLSAIRYHGQALLAAVADSPDARVEHCPDWDNTGLADHMRGVWGFMAAQARAASPEGPTRPDPDDASTPDQTLESLLAVLTDADPTAPAWNWCPEEGRTVAWILRRMAHETAIHRWDAENAAGDAEPIGADLAVDGVAEALEVAWGFRLRGPAPDYPAGSLHLHRTDGDGEWMVMAVGGALQVSEEHGKGDVAVRGTASDLDLFTWNRRRPDLEYFGDTAVVEAWAAVAP
jgi:uncharacterized protein (TIGR03083 family)